jgi:hypothetical protein
MALNLNLQTVFPYLASAQLANLTATQRLRLPQLPGGIVPAGGYMRPSNTPTASITTENTLVRLTNLDLAHVCDISGDIKRSAAYQYLKSHIGIEAITKALGITTTAKGLIPSALTTTLTAALEYVRDVLRTVNKYLKIVKAVADALILYVVIIRAVINWIMTLPAKLLRMMKECAFAFFNSIISIGNDLLSTPGGILGPEFKTLTNEMKATFNEAKSVIKNTLAVAQIPGQILNAVLNTNVTLNPDQALAALDGATINLQNTLTASTAFDPATLVPPTAVTQDAYPASGKTAIT